MIETILLWLTSLFVVVPDSTETVIPATSEIVIETEIQLKTETTITDEVQIEPEVTIAGESSEFSLQSFFDQEFVGTDFKVGNLIQDWGTHRSYYATHMSNGLKISGTWHVPKGEGPFPLIILNHGYFPPETYTNGYGFGREQKHFARLGYVVFHTDYRGYAFSDKDPLAYTGRRFGYTGYSADAINAILAIKAADLPQVDTDKVAMFGHSMGGGVTLNATLARPDLIDAAVLWGPVSSNTYDNFTKWSVNRISPEGKQVFEREFGVFDNPDSFKALSARTYLEKLQTPLLIQQGTEDEDCPVDWARATAAELERLEKKFKYVEYEGYPHVFWNQRWETAIAKAENFIAQNIK